MLGGGGGYNVTHLGVRCVCSSLGPPLAYIFPVPPRVQGRRQRAGDCGTVPGAGREPAELGEGKQGPRPLPSPRGRAPAAPAAAGIFPLSQRFSPAGLPRSPGGRAAPDPNPRARRRGCAPSILTWKGCPPPSKKLCLICAEPPRPRAEHAAPACSARVHPARRGGDRAEAVASGRCLGPDPLHVSLAWGHVHRLSPVRRPDVLRINKMKLEATGGQIAPVLRTTIPNRATSPLHRSPTAAPPPGRSPPSKLQPRRAPARPRPLAGPGALCRSH